MAVGEWRARLVERGRATGVKACGVVCVVALGAVGCGGQSTTNDAGGAGSAAVGAETGGAPSGGAIPTRGFYRKSIMTTMDSCMWSGTAAGDIALVGASTRSVAAELGPTNLPEEVPWQGLSLNLPRCNTTILAQVLSRSDSSFVIDVTEVWPAPDKCELTPAQVPASPCSGEWVETFKLVAACPTSVGLDSCD